MTGGAPSALRGLKAVAHGGGRGPVERGIQPMTGGSGHELAGFRGQLIIMAIIGTSSRLSPLQSNTFEDLAWHSL